MQWRAAHEALTPPPHNQDEHPIIASSTSSKIAAMINGMPPKTFNAIKDSSAALFYMLAIQVSTLHAELTQKPSGVVKLLKLLLELHVKSKEVIKNITEILARINLLIATTLKYKEDVTTYICICKGCNVIRISSDNAPSQMPCAKTPCNKRITLLARLIDLGQNNIIVWHEITKEPNWDNAMKIVQRFPDNFQQEFAELSSIIWDCIHDNITISWKISYIISRIKIIFAILDLLPNTAQDKFLEVTNSLLHTYKELITVLSLVFIAIISIRTEAWK